MEMQDHTLFIHLTLLPLVEVTNEIKQTYAAFCKS